MLVNRAKWDKVRSLALHRDHGVCVMCGQPANEVDHIREVADGGALYDLNNLQTLCHACHLRKSISRDRERRARRERESAAADEPSVTMSIWDRLGLGQ